MTHSGLYEVAFQCLLGNEISDFDEDFKNKIALHEEVFLKFIHLCSNHFILPAVFRRLKSKGFSDYLPADFAEHLNELLQINIERNNGILQQIDEISQHLDNAGIKPVFMKGTANLLDNLYVDIADRMIGDIDFLVRDEDFLPTVEIALKLGYKTDIEVYDEIKTLKDYPRLYRGDVPADLEIHRLPVIPEYVDWFGPELVFNKKKQIPDKTNCYVPSNKHKLIQNFIHSQLTNKGHKHRLVSLRDLYDCHLLLKRANKNEVLNEIKEREKAEIYFDFLHSLKNNNLGTDVLNKKSRDFITKHNWFLNHPRIHFCYIKFFKIKDLITNRFLKAFVDKTVFRNLYVRFTKPEWWHKRLFKGLKEYFS
jgi:hypothetical protein